MSVKLFEQNQDDAGRRVITFTMNGTDGEWVTRSADLGEFRFPHQYMKFYFGQSGLELGEIRMILKEEF